MPDFDRFFIEGGYKRGEEPQAMADYLASLADAPVDGFAVDLSAAVHGEPPAGVASSEVNA